MVHEVIGHHSVSTTSSSSGDSVKKLRQIASF